MKRKNIKQAVRDYYLLNPCAKLRVREIERAIKRPLPSVIRYCKELAKEGILTIEKTGNTVFYTADRTNENYLLEKKIYNLRSVHESGIIDYLKQELSNPPVVLFGSFSKGEDIETSDVDLYIETPSKKELHLERFEKFLRRKIQAFRQKSINELSNPHLANNIINGITLNSYMEVF